MTATLKILFDKCAFELSKRIPDKFRAALSS